MPKVLPLPHDVASRIAAGEVIERPASVLKELIENAIDAGAGRVAIEIEKAGRGLIRVSDDGAGMDPEDCVTAFERHTTSKISKFSDIDALETFGFRGEALFSIAAVSKVVLASSRAKDAAGRRVELKGGKLVSERDAPPVRGTSIEVRELFFNTPARAKFLKSDASEKGHLTRVVEEAALANPAVAFSFALDGRTVFKTPAQTKGPSAAALRARVAAVLGDGKGSDLLLAEGSLGGLKVTAFLSPLEDLVSSRSLQFCLINRRPVSDRTVQQALYRAYEPFRPKNRHPASVVFLEIPPDRVDVNVHPTKREVRFRSSGEVFETVTRAAARALLKAKGIPTLEAGRLTPAATALKGGGAATRPWAAPSQTASLIGEAGRQTPVAAAPPVENRPWFSDSLRFLGQLERAYLVFEENGGLLLIDQHAAQERVLFERFLGEVKNGNVAVQKLMLPIPVELPASAVQKVLAKGKRLRRIGFEVEPFGKTGLHVLSVPALFAKAREVEDMVHSVIDGLQAPEAATADARYDATATIACKAAVKAHDPLGPAEALRLVADLRACEDATCCPHGRPSMLSMNRDELARRFKRPGAPPL